MKEEIIKILEDKYQESKGHSGIYFPQVFAILNIPLTEVANVRNIINNLYKEKLIKVTDGAKGKLIFINKPKTK